MMKFVLACAALLIFADPASAISRYYSKTVSCQKARAIVAQQGAVIYRYQSKRNPSLTRYDRFVQHGGFCAIGEAAVPAGIPTSDNASCTLLRCGQSTEDGGFFRRKGGNGSGGTFYGRYIN